MVGFCSIVIMSVMADNKKRLTEYRQLFGQVRQAARVEEWDQVTTEKCSSSYYPLQQLRRLHIINDSALFPTIFSPPPA